MPSVALPAALANRLRFRHLMLLRQLGELGNLHRAAEAISLAQPSASKMLRDIEQSFGFALFERSAKGMGITELGRHVVEFAGSALVDFERFVADLEAKRRGGFGQLVVGGIMGAAPDVVARAVADLKKKRPLLAVRILGETSDQLLDLLQRRELDLAVGRFSAPLQHNRFDFEPLANELLCAVVRKGHPLCRARALQLADLVSWPWVLQLLSSPARQLMEDEFAQANLRTPENLVECGSIFAMLQLLQSSDAVAVLPESVVRDALDTGLLRRLPIAVGGKLSDFGVLTRRSEPLGPAALELVALMRVYAARMTKRNRARLARSRKPPPPPRRSKPG
jgi:DNA-binding transcriptional LysR family regulator